jgi:hypothetical protein
VYRRAANLDDKVNAASSRKIAHRLVPVRRRPIVYRFIRTESLMLAQHDARDARAEIGMIALHDVLPYATMNW